MKHTLKVLMALLLCLTMTGCGSLIPPRTTMPEFTQTPTAEQTKSTETTAAEQTEAVQSTETAPTQAVSTEPPMAPETAPGKKSDDPHAKMLRAYKAAMNRMQENMVFPVGTQEIELWDNAPLSDEHFALVDVTGDGVEELLVSISNTYVAGMAVQVCGYDKGSDEVKQLAMTFISSRFYSDGWIKADASHNHGMAGEVMWPYDCYRLGEDGSFHYAFSMDAWDRSFSETAQWDEAVTYPQEYDPENLGAVYLKRNYDTGEVSFMTKSDFTRFEAETFPESRELSIPWKTITEENLSLILE